MLWDAAVLSLSLTVFAKLHRGWSRRLQWRRSSSANAPASPMNRLTSPAKVELSDWLTILSLDRDN